MLQIFIEGSQRDDKKESIELNIEELKTALSEVDSQMKFLPAQARFMSYICLWYLQHYL